MTETYEWLPEKKARLKRRLMMGIIIQYLLVEGYFGYNMFAVCNNIAFTISSKASFSKMSVRSCIDFF
jgi:hypothetical protein